MTARRIRLEVLTFVRFCSALIFAASFGVSRTGMGLDRFIISEGVYVKYTQVARKICRFLVYGYYYAPMPRQNSLSSKPIPVRFTANQIALIKAAAAKTGISEAEVIRLAVAAGARILLKLGEDGIGEWLASQKDK